MQPQCKGGPTALTARSGSARHKARPGVPFLARSAFQHGGFSPAVRSLAQPRKTKARTTHQPMSGCQGP